jgi:hypothetical protein
MAACVPKRMDEGEAQDQAVAVCMSMWEKKSVTVTPELEFTETEMKIGARNSRPDGERLQMIHDYAVENGASCEKEEPDDEEEKALDEDTIINFGGEIKALADGKIGGYLVRFSGPDDPDASPQRDFFTANTDYGFKRGERKTTQERGDHRPSPGGPLGSERQPGGDPYPTGMQGLRQSGQQQHQEGGVNGVHGDGGVAVNRK